MLRYFSAAVLACIFSIISAAHAAEVTALPLLKPEPAESLTIEQLKSQTAKGDLKAQTELGARYGRGDGVPADLKQAIVLLQASAGKGEATAQYMLGIVYATGMGVVQDDVRAVEWYKKAAARNHPGALHELSAMTNSARGGLKADPAQERSYLQKAAELGFLPAAYRLAQLYQSGTGVPQDIEKAAHWYRRIIKTAPYNRATASLVVLIQTGFVEWQPGDPGQPAEKTK